MTDFTCPTCGAEFDLSVAFSHETDHRALARLAAVSIPLGARVLQYVALFQPPKQRLTAAKKIKLILQLLPDLERQAITHKGRDWKAPLEAWATAIDQMLTSRDTGRLELPMKGHAYLYSIMAGLADKHEAEWEATLEAGRRHTGRQRSSDAPTQVGQVLQATGRDPALTKLQADAQAATPMPADVRRRLAELRGKPQQEGHHDAD